MILSQKDPSGNDWDEGALHALGVTAITYTDDGVEVSPDVDLAGYQSSLAKRTLDGLRAYARAKSYEIRVGGTTVDGVPVKTDDVAIGLITAMEVMAKDDGAATFYYDGGGEESHELSAADAVALSQAVGKWVQGTFARRADVLSKIAAGTIKTTEDVDSALSAQ